jgi:asparagine synthase (glutamine-hydrolysing)
MTPERAHVYWNGTFSDVQKQALLRTELPPALNRVLGELRDRSAGNDDLEPYLWFDQRYFLPDDILNKADRMSMAHSLEVRPPFLDHRIVEFAASLPASLKIRGSRQKVLLKELMRDKLPPSVLRRKKIGFDIPAHDWLRGCLRPLRMEVLLDGSSDHARLFRQEVIATYIRQHLDRQVNVGYHLWGLMVLFLWMKNWGIQAAASRETSVWIQQKTGTYT